MDKLTILNGFDEFKKSKSKTIKNKIARFLLFNNAYTYEVLGKEQLKELQNSLKNN